MYKLLVINFLIKLYALKNIFNIILEKYGQPKLKLARCIERNRTKVSKIKHDIKFQITCKRNNLIPTFAKPKLSIKVSQSVKRRITRTIIDAELSNKYRKLKYLRRTVVEDKTQLVNTIGYISFCTFNKLVNKRMQGKQKQWKSIHEKKLSVLFQHVTPTPIIRKRPENIVHNFSSYILTKEEEYILSFGLDHHISSKMNKNSVKTEFEAFYYHLSKQLNHLEPNELSELKTKLRRSCENYCNINGETKLDDIISKLSRNNNVVVLKQDKGRGVVLIDRPKYVEKCMAHLNTNNFEKLTVDKTKSIEELVQKTLFRMKKDIGEDTYSSIYPS